MQSIITLTPDGRITDVNSSAEALLRGFRSDLVGKHVTQILIDASRVSGLIDMALNGVKPSRSAGSSPKLSLKALDGTVREVFFNAELRRNRNGEVEGIAVICSQRDENLDPFLSGIVRGAFFAILSANLEGVIVTWNESAAQMFGFKEDEIVGQHLTRLFACEREDIEGMMRAVLGGARINEIELPLNRGGNMKKVSVQFSRVVSAENKIIGVGAICRDVTAERSQIENIADEYRTIAQTNRLLTEHASGLSRQSAQMELFAELTGAFQVCESEQSLFELIVRMGSKFYPATSGAFYIASATGGALTQVANWGATPAGAELPAELAKSSCLAARQMRAHFSSKQANAPERCPHLDDDGRICLCVPMILSGELVGLMSISWSSDEILSDAAGIAARLLGDAALALANMRLKRELKELSIRDALTGLYNRRYMQEFLNQELVRSKRKRAELSVILFDVDHFKMFNDKHGHHAGDAVLREVGRLTAQKARASDVACRYGGEEFIIVFPEFRISAVAQRAEVIRQAAESMQVTYNGKVLPQVTLSLGVAGFPVHGDTADVIIRQADAALYSAKHLGRNRVVVASRAPSSRSK